MIPGPQINPGLRYTKADNALLAMNTMSHVEKVIPHETHIEFIFEGVIRSGFPEAPRNNQVMLDACKEHDCSRALADFTNVEYTPGQDILGEHIAAESLADPELRAIKWAELMPGAQAAIRTHLENTAVNRGVQLRVFTERTEALDWLLE